MTQDRLTYREDSEQFIAAVWYVVREAQRQYEKMEAGRARGRTYARWGFLTKVRGALGLKSQHVPYNIMRKQIEDFSKSFGLVHPPVDPEVLADFGKQAS